MIAFIDNCGIVFPTRVGVNRHIRGSEGISRVFPTRVGVNRLIQRMLTCMGSFSPPAWG